MKIKAYVFLDDLEDAVRNNLDYITVVIYPITGQECAEVLVDLERLTALSKNRYKYRRSSRH